MKRINDGLTRWQRYHRKHKEQRSLYQKQNRNKINARRKKNYKERPEIKEKLDEYRNENREKYREWGRDRDRKPERKLKKKKYFDKHYQKIVILKQEKGNKCQLCGYDKESKILHFHHINDKSFVISLAKLKPIEELRKEAEKCILICPNCHSEIHLKERPMHKYRKQKYQ